MSGAFRRGRLWCCHASAKPASVFSERIAMQSWPRGRGLLYCAATSTARTGSLCNRHALPEPSSAAYSTRAGHRTIPNTSYAALARTLSCMVRPSTIEHPYMHRPWIAVSVLNSGSAVCMLKNPELSPSTKSKFSRVLLGRRDLAANVVLQHGLLDWEPETSYRPSSATYTVCATPKRFSAATYLVRPLRIF
jgi:hypothetical protein